MRVSGKLVIGLILSVAFFAATFSWWFRWQATHRAAEFWGAEAVAVLQRPRQVIALQLGERPPIEQTEVGHPKQFLGYSVVAERAITTAGGVTHLRQALLEDRSYDWDMAIPEDSRPRYCLRLLSQEENRELILFFPSDFTWMRKVALAIGDETASLNSMPIPCISTAPIANGLRQYFADAFGDEFRR